MHPVSVPVLVQLLHCVCSQGDGESRPCNRRPRSCLHVYKTYSCLPRQSCYPQQMKLRLPRKSHDLPGIFQRNPGNSQLDLYRVVLGLCWHFCKY